MWYRVEFHRDGSIKQATAVESRGTDAGLVCYVDSDSNAAAVRDAIAWRKRYRESAREAQRANRRAALKNGLCRSCFRRKIKKGQKSCAECLASDKERRGSPHVVDIHPPSAELTAETIQGTIVEVYGKQHVSRVQVEAALRGEEVSADAAAKIARAIRTLGHPARALNRRHGQINPGRYTLAENELELLLTVQKQHGAMDEASFRGWIAKEIAVRRNRIALTAEEKGKAA